MRNTSSALATPRPRRRRLTSALLVLGLTVGSVAMTAKPAEAASAVVTCYTAIGSNFLLPGLKVQLLAADAFGNITRLGEGALDAGGCTAWNIPPAYRNHFLMTMIFYKDTGRFYGGLYDGRSSSAWSFSPTSGWTNYGTQTYGWAAGGEDIWYLFGTVSCSGCRWV